MFPPWTFFRSLALSLSPQRRLLSATVPPPAYSHSFLTLTNLSLSLLSLLHTHTQKMVDHRVTLRRRHAYRTASNKVKTVLTPGGKHVAQYIKKAKKGVICGDCHIVLPGIKHMDSRGFKNAHKREKTVSRAYGGSRCHKCVRNRIVRAFLVEEQKISKKVLAEKSKKTKKE